MLKTYELERLKSLVSGTKLETKAENETLDMLRSRFPNLLTQLGITGEKLKDNKYIIKSLSDPINWEKVKNALLREPGELSQAEISELVEILNKKTIATEKIIAQQTGQEPPPSAQTQTTGSISPNIIPTFSAPRYTEEPTAVNTPSQRSINIPALESSVSSGFKDIQDFGAQANPTVKWGINSIGNGIGGLFKGLGRGLGGTVGSGLGAAAPGLGKAFQGGLGGINRITRPEVFNGGLGGMAGKFGKGAKSASNKLSGGKKWIIGFLIFIVIIMFFFTPNNQTLTVPGATPGTTPGSTTGGGVTGAGCPDTSTNTTSCHYLNPSINLFDTTISQTSIDAYISKYSSVFTNANIGDLAEFTNRVNYIVKSSQQGGLNPAIFLGYWKTESMFSTIGTRDMGCVGNNFYEQVDCALAINEFYKPALNPIANCARSRDAQSVACQALKSIRETSKYDITHPINYPIATFDDFAESYGPIGHDPNNCTHTYNILIDTAKELGSCQATATVSLPTNSTLNSVMSWDQKIIDNLNTGLWGYYNKLTTDIPNGSYSTGTWASTNEGNVYWCTYSIIDAYNLAGIPGLSKSAHGAVINMRQFWSQTPNFKYLDYQNNNTSLQFVQPGYVIFMESIPGSFTGFEHAATIKTISFDTRGNGIIETNDSNSTQKSNRYPIAGWSIMNTPYTVTGFGGI